ncbi:MAG: flagellar hook-associated protein 3, partial [Arcobacter sp.]|nr:flagellar hook-associated protein 3 [Arcobacter sp.]
MPFEKNPDGTISYMGDNKLRKIAVEEGSYRERGITGFDAMTFSSSTAYKNENLVFKERDRVLDQEGNEWKLNSPTNDTLTKYDLDGNATTTTLPVTSNPDGTFSVTAPNDDGMKMEARTSVFDIIDEVVNALKKVDSSGNPISDTDAKALISKGLANVSAEFESINVAHAELGGRNKTFEIS